MYLLGGVHPVVRWQESHERVVTKWFAGLPRAAAPLWHVTQELGAIPACVKLAGVHAVVRWHESHDSAVGRCLAGFAFAVAPLWHVTHEAGAMPMCVNRPCGAGGSGPGSGDGGVTGRVEGGEGGVGLVADGGSG